MRKSTTRSLGEQLEFFSIRVRFSLDSPDPLCYNQFEEGESGALSPNLHLQIMIFKDDEVEERLATSALNALERVSDESDVDRSEVKPLHKGKADKDAPELSPGSKRLLGTMAFFESRKKVSEASGVTPAAVTQYKNGRLGIHKPDDEGRKDLAKKKEHIQETVVDKILYAVNLLDEDRMDTLSKVKDITAVVKDLATVADKLSDKIAASGIVHNLTFYTPKQQGEDKYEVIDV